MILDADSGKILGDIPGQKIAHGVAIVPKLNRGFITDGGGSGAVIVFDLKIVLRCWANWRQCPTPMESFMIPGTDRILISAGDSNSLADV